MVFFRQAGMEQVLIVDNHPLIREYLSGLLAKNGYEALTAEDGLSALGVLRKSRPRVIFVDLIMPNIDGMTLCRILRRLPAHKDAFLVILSALAAEAPTLTAGCGANAVIAKGQFKTMGESILKTLAEARAEGYIGSRAEILGIEELHVREISRELLSQKLHYELVLESLGEGILETTREERVIYGNPSAFVILGMLEERVLGMRLTELFPEPAQAVIERLLEEPSGRPEVRIGERQIAVRVYPFREPDVGTIMLLADVTERNRIEAMMLQAQRMETVGTLAAGVAHDFNNILMAVQANVSMMVLAVTRDHPHHERLRQIEGQIASAKRLTDQLLEYARGGRYEGRLFEVGRVIRETAETFGRTRKDITVLPEICATPCFIEGNPTQIEQLVLNILLNAGDAMPNGGLLRIETSVMERGRITSPSFTRGPGRYVLCGVTDSGSGMDEQTLLRVFEPFFSTKAAGKGLGLAAGYGIVQAHGGHIEAQSRLGHGSTFSVYLPLADVKEAAGNEAALPVAGGVETAPAPGTGRVLFVEDEGIIRLATGDMLMALGYDVIPAASGEEAISLFRENASSIRVVLLDLIMPGLSGAQVFHRIREIDPKARVVLSTGYSTDGAVRELIAMGALSVIQKPYTLEKLAAALSEVLGDADG